mmetsp:Transcript_10553/g.39260  ORF Transcript_10553/g.39260 Transcript_10553/m.39260 type:complete len:333 (+) Transcript_10553:331-1329(+)
MSNSQFAHNIGWVQSTRLGESFWNHHKTLSILADSILVETSDLFSVYSELSGQLCFKGSCSGNETRILGEGLKHIDSIINCTLHLGQNVVGGSTYNNGGNLSVLIIVLSENDDFLRSNLLHIHRVCTSHLLLGWCSNANHCRSSNCLAQASQVKLAYHLDCHHLVALNVMKSHISEGTLAHNHVNASISKSLNLSLNLLLLAQVVCEKLVSRGQLHNSLGLSGGNVHIDSENCNLCILYVLDGSIGVTRQYESLYDSGVVYRSSSNFHYSHIVGGKSEWVLWANSDASLSNDWTEQVGVSKLLCSNSGSHCLHNLVQITNVVNAVHLESVQD